MKTCTNPHHLNANPKVHARGLCRSCWMRLRKRGTLVPQRMSRVAEQVCVVENCDAPQKARGWCKRHYQVWLRGGDPENVRPWGRKHCTIPGCDRPHRTNDLCWMHHQRARRIKNSTLLSDDGPVLLKLQPFLPIIGGLVAHYGSISTVERGLGLSKGHLHNIASGRNKAIHIDIADQLCLFAGVPFTDEIVVPFKHSEGAGATGKVADAPSELQEAVA